MGFTIILCFVTVLDICRISDPTQPWLNFYWLFFLSQRMKRVEVQPIRYTWYSYTFCFKFDPSELKCPTHLSGREDPSALRKGYSFVSFHLGSPSRLVSSKLFRKWTLVCWWHHPLQPVSNSSHYRPQKIPVTTQQWLLQYWLLASSAMFNQLLSAVFLRV